MTYCLGIKVDRGLVFASDSRTNAGVDQVSIFSKMHTFGKPGDRLVCILTAGNLATTQAVLRQVRHDAAEGVTPCIDTARTLAEVAEYVGALSAAEQQKRRPLESEKFNPEASFIVGGQIGGEPHELFLVYPQGNFIRATPQTPYLQIGELKYGKPILDRIVCDDLPLELAARCALVSMDSTVRSNVTVGPPIELLTYELDSLASPNRLSFEEGHDYLRALRAAWQDALKRSFRDLPQVPVVRAQVRLLDARGDR